MHTDARLLANNTIIEGDICIIGAGAAGISMAMDWIGTPHKVILLEGRKQKFTGVDRTFTGILLERK